MRIYIYVDENDDHAEEIVIIMFVFFYVKMWIANWRLILRQCGANMIYTATLASE